MIIIADIKTCSASDDCNSTKHAMHMYNGILCMWRVQQSQQEIRMSYMYKIIKSTIDNPELVLAIW